METEDLIVNQFWLNFGVTTTVHPGYNCLWCINDELEVIRVVIPRELIMSCLDLSGNLGSVNESINKNSTAGLAFIRKIENNQDSSFMVPVFYSSEDNTDLLDKIIKSVLKYPDQVDNIMQKVRESELYRETLRELVTRKRYSRTSNLISFPLKRATNWRHVKAIDSDYDVTPPVYWYTHVNRELRLDFGFKYRMDLRKLLRKPSISGFISAPFILLILSVYYTYIFFAKKFSKTNNESFPPRQ